MDQLRFEECQSEPGKLAKITKSLPHLPIELWHQIFAFVMPNTELRWSFDKWRPPGDTRTTRMQLTGINVLDTITLAILGSRVQILNLIHWDPDRMLENSLAAQINNGRTMIHPSPSEYLDSIALRQLKDHDEKADVLWSGSSHAFWQWLPPQTPWRVSFDESEYHNQFRFEKELLHNPIRDLAFLYDVVIPQVKIDVEAFHWHSYWEPNCECCDRTILIRRDREELAEHARQIWDPVVAFLVSVAGDAEFGRHVREVKVTINVEVEDWREVSGAVETFWRRTAKKTSIANVGHAQAGPAGVLENLREHGTRFTVVLGDQGTYGDEGYLNITDSWNFAEASTCTHDESLRCDDYDNVVADSVRDEYPLDSREEMDCEQIAFQRAVNTCLKQQS